MSYAVCTRFPPSQTWPLPHRTVPLVLQSQLYTVGPPQPAFALRLEAVPDMDYDPLGEAVI